MHQERCGGRRAGAGRGCQAEAPPTGLFCRCSREAEADSARVKEVQKFINKGEKVRIPYPPPDFEDGILLLNR